MQRTAFRIFSFLPSPLVLCSAFFLPLSFLPSHSSQAAISDRRDEFQQLVLGVVQREVVPEIKALQGEKTISSPMYGVLHVTVTTLCKDLSWLQALTTKQRFCWGIIASCCGKIPVAKEQFDWIHSYKFLITHLGYIYTSYCAGKKLPEQKCLLSAESFPQEIAHSPSEDIKKYECDIYVRERERESKRESCLPSTIVMGCGMDCCAPS